MILGTRSNRISMAITNELLKRMSASYLSESVELKIISLASEVDGDGLFPMQKAGDFGILEDMLRSGKIDVIALGVGEIPLDRSIWSEVVAVLPRGPVEDILVSSVPLERMRPGSVIGVSSARQKSLMSNLRPDLCVKDFRETVNSRLDIGRGLDAFIVSRAGIELLRIDCPFFILDPTEFVPEPGQGATAVMCRTDSRYHKLLKDFDDQDTRICVESERFLLESTNKDDSAPIGIWVKKGQDDIRIHAIVLDDLGMESFCLDRSIDLQCLDEGLDAVLKELKYAWELVR